MFLMCFTATNMRIRTNAQIEEMSPLDDFRFYLLETERESEGVVTFESLRIKVALADTHV